MGAGREGGEWEGAQINPMTLATIVGCYFFAGVLYRVFWVQAIYGGSLLQMGCIEAAPCSSGEQPLCNRRKPKQLIHFQGCLCKHPPWMVLGGEKRESTLFKLPYVGTMLEQVLSLGWALQEKPFKLKGGG